MIPEAKEERVEKLVKYNVSLSQYENALAQEELRGEVTFSF